MTDKPPSKRTRQRRVAAWYADLFKDIPENWTPLEAVMSIKCLDEDGDVCLATRKTSGLAPWDAYGMLSYALDDYSSSTLANACSEDDDE